MIPRFLVRIAYVHRVDRPRQVAENRRDDVEPELPGETDLLLHPELRNDDGKHDPKETHDNLLSLLTPGSSRSVRGTSNFPCASPLHTSIHFGGLRTK